MNKFIQTHFFHHSTFPLPTKQKKENKIFFIIPPISIFLLFHLFNKTDPQTIILLNTINIITYFENLTFELCVLYTFNTRVKFCVNWIICTI